ncbi:MULTISPECIES: ATP-binding protein [Pseudidiomarina]|uniref:ATPase family protein associated with various cellular activities (AAA) n=2 Tax=Pseudidiomarina TaxID=2800384 RepID=A0A368USV1_9GAMM|nr:MULTISPECIES: MoxR family ATPase [Pseudidiomarina]PWW11198.1 ATPase family protein associated with various cellular activities (AAA) [Pseudidiomarina maritima]RBP88502.1 ATPase family protein associated with various cellular activities (AAA) [Pseudidiomarina tainanensis]RCW30454.1 ATPase family protein associated with various cellular activities (AAA) [Pseudidiomarina tainanensis]
MSNMYSCNPDDVKAIIHAQLQLIQSDPAQAQALAPLMLWGAPGVGKSTIVREICQQHGIQLIDIRLAQREPVDLRGLPVPNGDHVDWLLAGEWPRDPNSRGIILFDELSAADRTLQAAAYEIILDRRLGDLYSLPPGWLVMGAGNGMDDRAVSYSFSSALANRFCHLELQPNAEQWCLWAREQGLHSAVIAFLKYAPQHFFMLDENSERGWPSPRSWERVARLLSSSTGLNRHQLRIMVNGLIGPAAAVPFFGFWELEDELPNVNDMLLGKIPVSVPKRSDATYLFCAAITEQLWRGDKSQRAQRLNVFFEISLRLNSDFATMLMLDAMRDTSRTAAIANRNASLFGETMGNTDTIHPQRSAWLIEHPAYEQWTAKHGQSFANALAQGDLMPTANASNNVEAAL